MNIWLDDIRTMPLNFDVHCKTAWEAIELLKTGNVEEISLDHDLGDEVNGTGYDVACFIEKSAFEGTLKKIRVRFHTASPVGREKMKLVIKNAHRYWMRDSNQSA